MKVSLTARQRKLIKEIIKIQLDALRAILNDDSEEDITLFCIENEIDRNKLKIHTQANIEEWEYMYKNPSRVLDLEEVSFSNFKHILSTTPFKKSQKKTVSQVWRKIVVFDDLQFNLN